MTLQIRRKRWRCGPRLWAFGGARGDRDLKRTAARGGRDRRRMLSAVRQGQASWPRCVVGLAVARRGVQRPPAVAAWGTPSAFRTSRFVIRNLSSCITTKVKKAPPGYRRSPIRSSSAPSPNRRLGTLALELLRRSDLEASTAYQSLPEAEPDPVKLPTPSAKATRSRQTWSAK